MNDPRKHNTKTWRTDLKSTNMKPPLMVNCFKCNKEFGVKWVFGRKAYSQKNSWAYWTGETEGNKYMCDNCLIHFHRDDKPYFWSKVKDPKKRTRLSNYIIEETLSAS